MRVLTWLLRLLVFLALFGLALNNRHNAVMFGFFGAQWQAPLILMCLIFFAAGCTLGALAVLWHQWRKSPPGKTETDHPMSMGMPPSKAPPLPRYAQTPTVPSQFGAEASVGALTAHTPSQQDGSARGL